jgi:hypothetical protein
MKDAELVHSKMKQGKDNVKGDSGDSGGHINQIEMEQIEEYKEQYNAAHDFAIF